MQQNEIHIATVVTENYASISEYFFKSIQNDARIKLHLKKLDMDQFNNDGSFRSPGWYFLCVEKVRHLYNTMLSIPDVDYVINSDADVQYFNIDTLMHLIASARSRQLDFFGMREDAKEEFNGGWYIIKNDEKMHNFLQAVIKALEIESYPYADQTVINNFIFDKRRPKQFKVSYDFIPREYYVWGDGIPKTAQVAFHHAVNTNDKIGQLQKVRDLYYREAGDELETFVQTKQFSIVTGLIPLGLALVSIALPRFVDYAS